MASRLELWMPAADGVRLATTLWRPPGQGPWPVLLMRQPYGRPIASTVTYAHPSWYADQGFLVAVQDVRGCGESGGTFSGFRQEASDGAEAVRWCRRLSDADGRVGSYGFSYQGLTQLLLHDPAANDQQHLPDCLAPAMCGLDERLHWATQGGAHWWALGLGWALQLAALRCRRQGDQEGWLQIRRSLEQGEFLREGPLLLQRFDPDAMGLQWLKTDPGEPAHWRRHEPPQALLRRPMLLIGGWHDPHLSGVLDLWQRSRAAGGDPRLLIGAWTHLNWQGGVDAIQLAFFREHLCPARDTATVPPEPGPIRLQESSGGTWTQLVQPPEPPAQRWQLHSEGLAAARSDEGLLLEANGAAEPGSVAGLVRLVHDPWRPVPGRGGHLGLDAGCVERGDLDQRMDVACFTSPPLQAAVLLCGTPVLDLLVAADQTSFDLCLALSRLPASGNGVQQISSGVLRVTRAESDTATRRRIQLQPLRLQLQSGERLRLSIAAAAWPQIAVNTGMSDLAAAPPGPQHRLITLTLHSLSSQLWFQPLIGAN
ncbi:MAG: CocE/NonD family hydrolase [Synechococcaceae cyanobacterium]|nr:CocE/NonD family hydrolase [Synechococcaceae cyanobacterium]